MRTSPTPREPGAKPPRTATQPRAARTATARTAEVADVRPQPQQQEQPARRRKSAEDRRPVRLTFRAPEAQKVCVAGSFNDWKPETQLTERNGEWVAELQLEPGRYEYRFVVDGRWVEDPGAPQQATNPYGERNSVLTV